MTRRRESPLEAQARRAAAGRRVVLSCGGAMDGPFLAALQRLRQVGTLPNAGSISAWGDGVAQLGDQVRVNDGADKDL